GRGCLLLHGDAPSWRALGPGSWWNQKGTSPSAFYTPVELSPLAAGYRLVNTSRPVTVYSDPRGTVPLGTSLATDTATGRASAYLRERRFDYVITGAGFPARLFSDAEGGLPLGGLAWINALDYGSIQAAVDALPPDGGTVYIPASRPGDPAGPYTALTKPSYTPPLTLPPNRAIRILGDGPFATYLRSDDFTKDMIVMGGDYQTIEGITLLGPFVPAPDPDTQGRGVVILRTGPYAIPYQADTATTISYHPRIKDCRIEQTSSWGVFIGPSQQPTPPKLTVWATFENVEIRDCSAGGCIRINGGGSAALNFKNCNLKNYTGNGIKATGDLISLIDCIVEGERGVGSPAPSPIELTDCSGVLIQRCWFESIRPGGGYSIRLLGTCRNVTIASCFFARLATSVSGAAIEVGGFARGVLIVEPHILARQPAGGSGEIMIHESTVSGTHNEVTVVGGSVAYDEAPSIYADPQIIDNANVTQLIRSSLINTGEAE
ncbi:MAG: right-handed parallel beta-helix repeat-containing protein, partial [Candidatus Eiseniibacteriota bacterium]